MSIHQDPNKIIIFDTTLRDGEQALPQSLSTQQKLQIAMALDQLGVDVIETGFPISSEGDFQSVQTISKSLKHAIPCGLARCVPKDVDACGNAMKGVDHFRIHTFIATSDIHVQDKLKKSRDDIMAMATAWAWKFMRPQTAMLPIKLPCPLGQCARQSLASICLGNSVSGLRMWWSSRRAAARFSPTVLRI